MNEPLLTYRISWWERRLVKMFGKKLYADGKFIGWMWNGRLFF
jgi:hypothetical protein